MQVLVLDIWGCLSLGPPEVVGVAVTVGQPRLDC